MPSNPTQLRLQRNLKGVRSQLLGVREYRALLRQLPPAVKAEMADILTDAGQDYLAAFRAEISVRTGALRGALAAKVLRASLRLRVGLVSKASNRKFFYARILEGGRKAQEVTIERGPHAGARLKVRAIAPRPVLFRRRPDLRGKLNRSLSGFWELALERASGGIADG